MKEADRKREEGRLRRAVMRGTKVAWDVKGAWAWLEHRWMGGVEP